MFTKYFAIPAILSIACLFSGMDAVFAQRRGHSVGHVAHMSRGHVAVAPRNHLSLAPRNRMSVTPRNRAFITPRANSFNTRRGSINSLSFNRNRFNRAFSTPRANFFNARRGSINSLSFNRNRFNRGFWPRYYAGYGWPGYYGSGYYGSGSYGSGNYGSGYSYPYDGYGYGYSSPYGYVPYDYSPDYSYSNPSSYGMQADTATIRVLLPNSQALVWLDGVQTNQTGTDRVFYTPVLTVGSSYTYRIQASWMDINGTVSQERIITVVPGSTTVVDFTQSGAVSSPRY